MKCSTALLRLRWSMCAEPGEYNASHIPGSSLIPRRMLEFDLPVAVPHPSSLTVLCDDDGQRVSRAVETVEAMGYSNVAWLDGGVNRWMSLDYPTEWGVNVPSKDFGEKVEVLTTSQRLMLSSCAPGWIGATRW